MKSSYYPPRARWPGRAMSPWFAFRRRTRFDKLRIGGLGPWDFLLTIAIPGWGFRVTGQRTISRVVLSAYVLAVLGFAAFLGHTSANVLYGLVIALHAAGIQRLATYCSGKMTLDWQAWTALAATAALAVGLYWPLFGWIQNGWLMPLQTPNGVVIVRTGVTPSGAGDLAAFRVEAGRVRQGVVFRSGHGVGMILASPGDRVEFSEITVKVNGKAHPRQPHMPTQGSLIVPEKHWFIWPNLDIRIMNDAGQQAAIDALLFVALVPDDHMVGRPFRYWFGRRQIVA